MAVRCSIQFAASGVRQTALPGVGIVECVRSVVAISVCVMTVRPGQIQRARCYLQGVGGLLELDGDELEDTRLIK